MSSLVSDFIINPVLRQARRFSEASRTTLGAGGDDAATPPDAVLESDKEDDATTAIARVPTAAPQPDSTTPIISDVMQPTPSSSPVSASTQATRVDELPAGSMVVDETPRDHLGFPLSPVRKGQRIPEDDGMGLLRSRIQDINSRNIPQSAKARLMHDALLERYRASQGTIADVKLDSEAQEVLGQVWEPSTSPSAGALDSLKFWQSPTHDEEQGEKFILTESDKAPSFAPIRRSKSAGTDTPVTGTATGTTTPAAGVFPNLGCQHYERNVKLQCSTCKKWYPCRFCHDAVEDHALIRKDTKNMLCMICTTPQKASDTCISCGEVSAQYYCNICKLWENRQSKPIYHCADCGICRRGLGLGKDFVHCKTCSACIPTSIESSHKCIERSTDCDCPICGDYMFTSPKPVVFMTCGHSIHKKCYNQHMKVSYKCPICNKSLANMETQFRNLDVHIQGQPMPPEFRDTKAMILCNDCSGKCTVPYHWLGLKCSICRSYNTVELQILGGDRTGMQIGTNPPAAATTPSAAVATAIHTPAPLDVPSTRDITSRPQAISAISALPLSLPQSSEPAAIPVNRRRHSSHGTELFHHMSGQFARSMGAIISGVSASGAAIGGGSAALGNDSDSEDDMLGFWQNAADAVNGLHNRLRGEGSSDLGNGSEMSDVEEEDEEDEDEEEEEEEEDENELFLIGHR